MNEISIIETLYPRLRGSVFIVTYGRTGSTVLQRILQTLPDSCIRGENYHMLGRLHAAYNAANVTKTKFGKYPCGPKNPWHGADHVNPDAIGRQLANIFITEMIKPYPSVKYIGFKEIRWRWSADLKRMLDFIVKFFPDPLFIFNSRNIEDVKKSAWWNDQPDNAQETAETMARFFDEHANSWPGRVLRTSYEEFTVDPTALAMVFDYFGETLDTDLVTEILAEKLPH